MKKIIGIFAVMLLALSLPLAIFAVASETCSVSVESVSAMAGDTITVAVRITDNPGFTNFSIELEYDPDLLILKDIQTGDENGPFLCGQFVSVHTQLSGNTGARVVAACADTVESDGILFTATFVVSQGAHGTTAVTPRVKYIRNSGSSGAIFEEILATVQAGTVTIHIPGDINGDGYVEYDDVMLAYRSYRKDVVLSEEQLTMVDTNRNGIVEESEYLMIYRIYIGG